MRNSAVGSTHVAAQRLSPAKHSQPRHVQSRGTLTAGMPHASRHALSSRTMSYQHLERSPVVSEVGVASFGGRLSCRSEDRKIAGAGRCAKKHTRQAYMPVWEHLSSRDAAQSGATGTKVSSCHLFTHRTRFASRAPINFTPRHHDTA